MTYELMAGDLAKLVEDMGLGAVNIVGHSMGGRTAMLAALQEKVKLEKLIVVDISPLNQDFDVTSNNEWNMEHYFHCLKAVNFRQDVNISQARKDADVQLSTRIHDAGLRAWLLMNMKQDSVTKRIGWRINVDGIHSAFVDNIAMFPAMLNTMHIITD